MYHNVAAEKLKELKQTKIKPRYDDDVHIQGTTDVLQLLTIPHKESEAGANPREFQGMKSATNKIILESLLTDPNNFGSYNQGVTLTVVGLNSENIEDNNPEDIKFDNACLVNGLQTVTIARILVLLKVYQEDNARKEVHKKINKASATKWHECIDKYFSHDACEQLQAISIDHINSVLNWLYQAKNKSCLNTFNKMTLSNVLDVKLTFKMIILEKFIIDDDTKKDEYKLSDIGMAIAAANNETQKVKADDLFGTKYRVPLENELCSKVELPYKIEYVRGENNRRDIEFKNTHILEILKAVLATTLLMECGKTPDEFVANYGAHRERVYNFFRKAIEISKDDRNQSYAKVKKIFKIYSSVMPQLLDLRSEVEKEWINQRSLLTADYIEHEWGHGIRGTYLENNIYIDKKEDKERTNPDDINRAIKENFTFSFSNVFPIFVFATKSIIEIDDCYNARYIIDQKTIGKVVYAIYSMLVDFRLKKRYSSTSNMFRDTEIYSSAMRKYHEVVKFAELDVHHDYIKDMRETI